MSKTPGESRIPMLFASRRTQQPAPAANEAPVVVPTAASRLPRGSVPGSPTASSSSSLRGSAPGTPTSTRRAAAASPRPQRGSTPDPADGHGGGMPALRQGLGGGRVSKLAKSASATTTRAMAAAAAAATSAPRQPRPARPTSFPRPMLVSSASEPAAAAASRPVIDSTTRESSPVSERPPTIVAADLEERVWNPDGIGPQHVGCRVQIAGEKTGTLRYFGAIALASGDFCGVELDEAGGKHDGTVRGVSYFRCAPLHGLLAPLHLVRLCADANTPVLAGPPPGTLDAEAAALADVDSGPHSILDLDMVLAGHGAREARFLQHPMDKDALCSPTSTPTSAAEGVSSPGPLGHCLGGPQQPPHFLHLMEKQHSFELDESLGILTPDQMADGFTACDGSSPEEETKPAEPMELEEDEATAAEEAAAPADQVLQVVEMVDCALRTAAGLAAEDAAPDALASSRTCRDVSTSDYISEDLASKSVRLDRTPSVEELPLDTHHQQHATEAAGAAGAITPGAATPSRSARGGKTPNSIITSVTSIASLDTGYQGDGEWSRPGSRGAEGPEALPDGLVNAIKMKTAVRADRAPAPDPMTDSDFFTESDADVQEDRLGGGGDRHAQVIDGTLYGGAAGGAAHRPHPAGAGSEDMDSSGIYSDLERPKESQALKEGRTLASLNQELVETLRNMLPVAEPADQVMEDRGAEDTGSMTSLVTVKSLQQQQQQQGAVPAAAQAATPVKKSAAKEIKKYKMPNRNVTSKVKAMMVVAARPQHEDQENAAPPAKRHAAPKNKKWEAVMQKIASNAEEQSSKLARLKDVKGKVLSSMGVSLTPALTPAGSNLPSRKNSALSSPRSADQRKIKSRRHRLEGPSPSTPSVSGTPVMSPDQRSTASTPRSSLSDVSRASGNHHHQLGQQRTPTSRSNNNNNKNRSSSPLSDVSVNSTTNTTSSNRTKSATLPTPRATAHGGARERSARDKAESADVLKKNQRNKTTVTPVLSRTDKAWSGSSGRVAEKAVPKSPSPRKTTAQRRTTPLKDHNGRVQLEPVAKQGSALPAAAAATAPAAARRVNGGLRPGAPLAASSPNVSPGAVAAAGPRAPPRPTPQEVAAEVRKRLLPDLRHNAAAVEAMAVLLDYTTNKLGAFAAPALRRDLEKMKSDMANTVIQLEEARTQYRLLEEEHGRHVEEAALQRARRDDQDRALAELQQRLAGHDELVQSIRSAHAGEVSALRAQMEGREVEAADAVAAATRGLREEYELELDRVSRRHEQTLAAALAAARADADREAAQRAQEAARREAEVAAQLAASGAAHAALREQSRRVVDSMRSDKDARTQALAGRCRELQDEVDSLRSVLELRCDELQKSRRENDALRIAADQLPAAEQRISTLTARLEDLQVQLDRKGELESKLVMENSELQQSFCKEMKEKQMLSLQNEQLQFKLKQNTEVVNALAANMSDFHDVSAIMNASADRSRRNASSGNNNNNKGSASPPESPRVKGVVEKSESVSYMLEMEMDSTDDVVARIYRRMASTPVSSPAHSAHLTHPRSAPPAARRSAPATPKLSNPLAQSASATTIPVALTASPSGRPTPKQRTTSASSRVRSRSISSDSGECLSSGNWSPPSSLPQHRPEHLQEQQQQRQHRGARTPDGLLAPSSGIGYDCSDIEDFSSSKSSSMSCSSEGSELSGLGLGKGHDEDADERAEAEAEVAPAMLDLMATSCGSTGVTLPQDAGGEAMMEEMNEEVNGLNSSSEDGNASCSDDDDDSSGRGRRGHRGRLARLELPPMTPTAGGGCGQSAINTPMDSSWSEDMELPVSLSET